MLDKFGDMLRTGAFLTADRLRFVPLALLFGYAIAVAMMFATAHGAIDYKGRPLGTDFSNVYAAGTAVLHGHASAPFDPHSQYGQEQALFGHATPFYGWHYPPYFLLVAAPLAMLPYLAALGLYQLVTLGLYLFAMHMLLRRRANGSADRRWLLLAVAFPAAFVNLTHGNNGFLTTALLAAGLAMLDERPILAGVVLGCLVYKPQFAILVPLALAAGGYRRTIAAGLVTVLALSAVVTLVFGADVWRAFAASTQFARTVVLEDGDTGFNKIQSVFAWVRLWHGSVALAYSAQACTSLAAALLVVGLWRGNSGFAWRGAALCLAALLATPYCLDYDLVALAPAIALLAADGLAQGFFPYEKTLLAGLWLVPIVAREIAGAVLIPAGPILLIAAAVFVKRYARPAPGGASDPRQAMPGVPRPAK